MYVLELDVGLWFDYCTKIDSILVPDIENLISEDLVKFGKWFFHFSNAVHGFSQLHIFPDFSPLCRGMFSRILYKLPESNNSSSQLN